MATSIKPDSIIQGPTPKEDDVITGPGENDVIGEPTVGSQFSSQSAESTGISSAPPHKPPEEGYSPGAFQELHRREEQNYSDNIARLQEIRKRASPEQQTRIDQMIERYTDPLIGGRVTANNRESYVDAQGVFRPATSASNSARGVATGALNTLPFIAEIGAKLVGATDVAHFLGDVQQAVRETMDPQGVSGAIGELGGGVIGGGAPGARQVFQGANALGLKVLSRVPGIGPHVSALVRAAGAEGAGVATRFMANVAGAAGFDLAQTVAVLKDPSMSAKDKIHQIGLIAAFNIGAGATHTALGGVPESAPTKVKPAVATASTLAQPAGEASQGELFSKLQYTQPFPNQGDQLGISHLPEASRTPRTLADVLSKPAMSPALDQTVIPLTENMLSGGEGPQMGLADQPKPPKLPPRAPSSEPVSVNTGNPATDEEIAKLTAQLAQEKSLRNEAERRAATDEATGLANKASFNKAVPDPKLPLTDGRHVGFVDLNGLKAVNDKAGHDQGDAAIKNAAMVLGTAAQQHGLGNSVFRIGGDEFAVLGPPNKVAAVLKAADELHGTKDFGGQKSSLSYGSGPTVAEAEIKMYQMKKQLGASRTDAGLHKDRPAVPSAPGETAAPPAGEPRGSAAGAVHDVAPVSGEDAHQTVVNAIESEKVPLDENATYQVGNRKFRLATGAGRDVVEVGGPKPYPPHQLPSGHQIDLHDRAAVQARLKQTREGLAAFEHEVEGQRGVPGLDAMRNKAEADIKILETALKTSAREHAQFPEVPPFMEDKPASNIKVSPGLGVPDEHDVIGAPVNDESTQASQEETAFIKSGAGKNRPILEAPDGGPLRPTTEVMQGIIDNGLSSIVREQVGPKPRHGEVEMVARRVLAQYELEHGFDAGPGGVHPPRAVETPSQTAPAEGLVGPKVKEQPAGQELAAAKPPTTVEEALSRADDLIDVAERQHKDGVLSEAEYVQRLRDIAAAKEEIKARFAGAKPIEITPQIDNVVKAGINPDAVAAQQAADDAAYRKQLGPLAQKAMKGTKNLTDHDLASVSQFLAHQKTTMDRLSFRDQYGELERKVNEDLIRRANSSVVDRLGDERGSLNFGMDPLHKEIPKNAPPFMQRVFGEMHVGPIDAPEKLPFLTPVEKLYAAVTQGRYAFTKFSKADAPAARNAFKLSQLFSGVFDAADSRLEVGYLFPDADGNLTVKGAKGLKQILAPLTGDKVQYWRAYRMVARIVELGPDSKATGVAFPDALRAKAWIEQHYPDVAVAGREGSAFDRDALRALKDAGIFSPKLFDILEQIVHSYAPLHRIMIGQDLGASELGVKALIPGESPAGATQPVQKRLGSKKVVRDIIETTVDQVRRFTRMERLNQIAVTMINAVEENPEYFGQWITRDYTPGQPHEAEVAVQAGNIRTAMKNRGIEMSAAQAAELAAGLLQAEKTVGNKLKVWRNGEMETWNIPDELAQAFNSFTPEEMNTLLYVAGGPARALHTGITNNPLFAATMAMIDNHEASVQSNYGFRYGIDWGRGFIDAMLGGEAYQEMRQGGGGFGGLAGSKGRDIRKEVSRILPLTTAEHAVEIVRHPFEALREATRPFEEAARVGEFIRAREANAPTLDASMAARLVIPDFATQGNHAVIRGLNAITAFLRPAIAGVNGNLDAMVRTARQFKNNPKEYVKRTKAIQLVGVATIMMPSVYLWAANHGDKQIEEMRKAPGGEEYWFWRKPDGSIVKYRKPLFFGQVFGTSVESALDKVADGDPEAAHRLAQGIIRHSVPSSFPNALNFIYGLMAHKDFNTGLNIAPDKLVSGRDAVEPQLRYKTNTSKLAKRIGAVANVSPSYVDFTIRSLGGTLGPESVKFIDQVILKGSGPARTPSDEPFIGRFTTTGHTQNTYSLRKFRDDAQKYQINANTLQAYIDRGDVTSAQAYKAAHGEQIAIAEAYREMASSIGQIASKAVWYSELPDEVMSPDAKRRQIDKAVDVINLMARRFNNRAYAQHPKLLTKPSVSE